MNNIAFYTHKLNTTRLLRNRQQMLKTVAQLTLRLEAAEQELAALIREINQLTGGMNVEENPEWLMGDDSIGGCLFGRAVHPGAVDLLRDQQ